jgi:hypothetical protein
MNALGRLERIAAALRASDAEWLREQLEQPWQRRQRRLAERDAAVRLARDCFAELRTTAAAEAVARDLGRYVAAGWHRERHLPELPPTASPLRRALHRIARADDGAAIGARRIVTILARALPVVLDDW